MKCARRSISTKIWPTRVSFHLRNWERKAIRKRWRYWWKASRRPGRWTRRSNSCAAFRKTPSPIRRSGESAVCRMTLSRWAGAARMYLMFIRNLRRRQAMAAHIRTGKSNGSRRGFTIIELMVVMTIISILMSLAIPAYQKAILRSKESVLRNNLFTMRTVIDEYTYDKQKAPQTLQDLVSEGYLRAVPKDPMTDSDSSWKVIMEDAGSSVNQ